jgi:hypothetical protein
MLFVCLFVSAASKQAPTTKVNTEAASRVIAHSIGNAPKEGFSLSLFFFLDCWTLFAD